MAQLLRATTLRRLGVTANTRWLGIAGAMSETSLKPSVKVVPTRLNGVDVKAPPTASRTLEVMRLETAGAFRAAMRSVPAAVAVISTAEHAEAEASI